MDISELVGDVPAVPNATQSEPQATAVPNPLESTVASLSAEVAKTRSTLDDMVAKQAAAALTSEFNNFKGSIADFDEDALFGEMQNIYKEYMADGASEEQAQALVDKVYQNPIGWKALWAQVQMKREPAPPDAIIPSAANTTVDELPANRAGLGKILNREGDKK